MCSAQQLPRSGPEPPDAPRPDPNSARPASSARTGEPVGPQRPEAAEDPDSPLEFLLVRELDQDDEDHEIVLRPEKAAYFFLGSAVKRGLIHARWTPAPRVRPHVLYVRTTGGSTYRTQYRSVAAICRRLGQRFVCIHQGLLLNLDALQRLYLRQRVPMAGVAVGSGIEYVSISRRRLGEFRRRIS